MLFRLTPLIALLLLTGCVVPPQRTSVMVGVSSPNVRMSVHVPSYPDMVPVPGYPVYYAPSLGYNYFFYDGLYWVYYGDYWYSSTWYNGPWEAVHPYYVPAFILRIPVRYYRVPPRHFQSWHPDAPPRWGERWGHEWSQRRSGWDHWDRKAEPARAPLPHYQRDDSGRRYPPAEQQRPLNRDHDRYPPGESKGHDRREPRELMRDIPNTETPMPMGREAPARETMRNESNPGHMPPQMRRNETQQSDYPAPAMQEPLRRGSPGETQMREQPAPPMLSPGRGQERDERRGENRGYERGDSRMDNRGERDRGDRRNNGERYR